MAMASVAGFAAMAMAFPPSAARNFSASAPCSCREAAARSGAFRHEAFPSRLHSGSLSNAGADWRTFKLRNPASVFSTERRLRRLVTRAAAKDSLYDTLGVSATATEKEIKQAYRRLALKFHPDVNKAPNAQEKFLEIKKAYQTLVDAQSRAKYDSSRQPSSTREPFNWGRDSQSQRKPAQEEEFYGLGEFFSDLQTSLGSIVNLVGNDDFFRDLQSDYQKKSSQGRPKSLWEELADIGEEFVDFLEKELEIIDANGNYKEPFRPSKPYDFDPNDWTQSAKQAEEQAKSKVKDAKSKVEDELSDIEDMMAKLKKELGL